MATVTVENSAVNLTIQNLSAHAIVALNRKLEIGGSADVPRRYLNYDRAKDLAELINAGYISVTVDDTTYSLSGFGPLTAEFIQGLAEPTGAPFAGVLSYPTASRPAAGAVPDGTMAWDSTLAQPIWAKAAGATGWVDATGADA